MGKARFGAAKYYDWETPGARAFIADVAQGRRDLPEWRDYIPRDIDGDLPTYAAVNAQVVKLRRNLRKPATVHR